MTDWDCKKINQNYDLVFCTAKTNLLHNEERRNLFIFAYFSHMTHAVRVFVLLINLANYKRLFFYSNNNNG